MRDIPQGPTSFREEESDNGDPSANPVRVTGDAQSPHAPSSKPDIVLIEDYDPKADEYLVRYTDGENRWEKQTGKNQEMIEYWRKSKEILRVYQGFWSQAEAKDQDEITREVEDDQKTQAEGVQYDSDDDSDFSEDENEPKPPGQDGVSLKHGVLISLPNSTRSMLA
jgi:hypothetical protein